MNEERKRKQLKKERQAFKNRISITRNQQEHTTIIQFPTHLESAKDAALRTRPSSSAPVKFFVMRASSGKL